MVNRIEWHGQNKQVVLQTYEGKTTWDIFLEIATQSAKMLNSVEHPVQLIIDRSNAFFPKFKPTEMKNINNLVPDNQDLVVVVGAEYSVETLSKVVGVRIAPRAFTKNTYYVSSMEEAHAILKRERGID